jgi:peptidoglycan hydrolase-like protein with peptidoglycan-binding domain
MIKQPTICTTIGRAAVGAVLLSFFSALPMAALAEAQQKAPEAAAPSPMAPAARSTKTMKHHHAQKSHKLKAAQEALNTHGAKLTADGVMGPKTRAALEAFQKAHGLKVSGRLDQATEKALGLGRT